MSSGAQGWLGEHMDCICESKLEVVGIYIYIYIAVRKETLFNQKRRRKAEAKVNREYTKDTPKEKEKQEYFKEKE